MFGQQPAQIGGQCGLYVAGDADVQPGHRLHCQHLVLLPGNFARNAHPVAPGQSDVPLADALLPGIDRIPAQRLQQPLQSGGSLHGFFQQMETAGQSEYRRIPRPQPDLLYLAGQRGGDARQHPAQFPGDLGRCLPICLHMLHFRFLWDFVFRI